MIHGALCKKHAELGGRRHNGGNCVACTKAAKKAYNARNSERIAVEMKAYRAANKGRLAELNARWRTANKVKVRETNLRRAGFTGRLFQEAVQLQRGRCAICKIDLLKLPTKHVHADHCHLTGLARGVLCHHCNAGLGAFRDDPESLACAIAYLKTPPLGLI